MSVVNFIKSDEKKELFRKLVSDHKKEFKKTGECLLYENKLFDQTYTHLILEAYETDSLANMADSLRFRVDFYDIMGMNTEAELVYQEFYDFTVDGYNAAKKWADDVIEAIRDDTSNIPLF